MARTVRPAAVAGRFYPADPQTLRRDVLSYFPTDGLAPVRALGCIAPHAGYMYSGQVAGAVFAHIEVPTRCIVICPNHTGLGRPLAIMSEGEWETPLGSISLDTSLAVALKQRFPQLEEDSAAHQAEHAAEVELPFLKVRQPNIQFVPIAVGTRQFEILQQLGVAMADVVAQQKGPVLIIASSDMNHYESDIVTRQKDGKAIEQIMALDAPGLYEVVMRESISMCGFGPAVVMLVAAKKLGATSAELSKYATSGDVSGDLNMVVGYAGVVIV